MKYTEFIINDSVVDIERIIPEKRYIKQVTILVMLPVALAGVVILTCMLPATLTVDGLRSLKFQYYRLQKNKRKFEFFTEILTSLSIKVKPSSILAITNVNYPILNINYLNYPKLYYKTKIKFF